MAASAVSMVALAGNVEQPAIGANPRRKRITFASSVPTAALYVRPDSKGNVADGFPIVGNSGKCSFSVEDYGDLVTGPWWIFATAPINVGVIETIE